MTLKQIEAAREIRLWIGQIMMPVTIGTVLILSNQKVRFKIKQTTSKAKQFIKNKFSKKKSNLD